MTAIELYYSSLPTDLLQKPYFEDDYEDMPISDVEIDAMHEYRLMMEAGIRPSSFEADFMDA